MSGNISEEQTYVRLNDKLAKFRNIEQVLKNYKESTVDFLFQKKQEVLESVTDDRRKRQGGINRQQGKERQN